jgi:hypothetical protein
MKRTSILLAALWLWIWTADSLGGLQQVETERADDQQIAFVTLTNGTVLQGKVELPLEVKLKSFDGIFMTANGGPVSGYSATIHSNSTGRWFLDWNTQDYPNGVYDIYLEADSGDSSYYSATNTIVVSNLVSFDPFPSYGSQMWIRARLAVQCADWKVKMYDSKDQYVGYFKGTTTNGFISFIWKFQDINGKTFSSEPFYSTKILVTPLDNCKPALPTNHPNPQLVSSAFPLDDKTPHKLIPPEKEEK